MTTWAERLAELRDVSERMEAAARRGERPDCELCLEAAVNLQAAATEIEVLVRDGESAKARLEAVRAAVGDG